MNKRVFLYIVIANNPMLNSKEYILCLFNFITIGLLVSTSNGTHAQLSIGIYKYEIKFSIHQWLVNLANAIINNKPLVTKKITDWKLSKVILHIDNYYYLAMERIYEGEVCYRMAYNDEVAYNGFEYLNDALARLFEEFEQRKQYAHNES